MDTLDPYDWYLAGFRSAYLERAAPPELPPSARHRAAFELGAEDGRGRCVAPRSRWQIAAALARLT